MKVFNNKNAYITMTIFIIYFCLLYYQAKFQKKNISFKAYNVNDKLHTKHTKKQKVLLFAAIFSYLTFQDRRNAIRTTWLRDCKKNPIAVCKFVIDALDNEGKDIAINKKMKIDVEENLNKDLIFLESFAGVNFAYRFYKLMKWANERYDFDFILRIDDDQYLCFDRLVYELPYRNKEDPVVWGFMHCQKDVVRIDEGLIMFSRCLFDMLMERYDSLMCHKYGGQAIALWLVEIQKFDIIKFFQDSRIYHGVASYSDKIKNTTDICHKYLSLHGTYPKEMKMFHDKDKVYRNNSNKTYAITPITKKCPLSTKTFNISFFQGGWFSTTKLCKDKPIWNNTKVFRGRQRNHKIVL